MNITKGTTPQLPAKSVFVTHSKVSGHGVIYTGKYKLWESKIRLLVILIFTPGAKIKWIF